MHCNEIGTKLTFYFYFQSFTALKKRNIFCGKLLFETDILKSVGVFITTVYTTVINLAKTGTFMIQKRIADNENGF